ncbi:hypothetical protein ACFQ51_51095 [Streptomyces kaempferi]
MLTFRTLGLLEVTRDGRPVTPTAPKVRQMLALLLARRNTLVSISAIAANCGSAPRRAAPPPPSRPTSTSCANSCRATTRRPPERDRSSPGPPATSCG